MLEFLDMVSLSKGGEGGEGSGLRLVQALNPFRLVFSIFHDPRYLLSESAVLLSQVSESE